MNNTNNFLPSEEVEPKSKSNYTMPLDEGRHKLRVLSSAIVGWEGWGTVDDKKAPTRYKVGTQPEFGGDGKPTKYFWAFLVYNYDQERIQIMSITQKRIRQQIKALIEDEVWGNPQEFDFTITRVGTTKDDTVHTVMPNPKLPVSPEIKKLYEEKNIDLNIWMAGGDPFSSETPNSTNPTPTSPSTASQPPSEPQIDSTVNVENIDFDNEPPRA